MRNPTDDEIAGRLVAIISDGVNRSLGALEAAGALDLTKLRRHYAGVGSKYYEIVTKQIVLTARYGVPGLRKLVQEDGKLPLVAIISDGFNRSLGALEAAWAVNRSKLRAHYKGVGSKYYDIVTEQIELAAKHGEPGLRELFLKNGDVPRAR